MKAAATLSEYARCIETRCCKIAVFHVLQLFTFAGHISQGPVLRYYSTRTQQLLCQLKEVAAHAVAAAAVGVERESDSGESCVEYLISRIPCETDRLTSLARLGVSKATECIP